MAESTLYNTLATGIPRGANNFIWQVSNGTCTDQITVQISNNSFDVNAGADVHICSDSYTMPAPALASGTGVWSIISGSGTFANATENNTAVTGLGQSENIFKWTVTDKGCSLPDTVSIFNDSPSLAVVGADQEICSTTGNLSATGASRGTGYWTVLYGSSAIVANSLDPSSAVSNLDAGDNVFRWTVQYGSCTSSADLTITNHKVTANAGIDKTVCSPATSLAAIVSGGGTGSWTVNTGASIAVSSQYNTSVSNLDLGPNTFTWTVDWGTCSASDNVVITNDSVYSTASDISTCDGTAVLTGNDPGLQSRATGGRWRTYPSGVVFDNSNNYNANVSNIPLGGNKFTWEIYNANCSDSVEITVTNNYFTVNAGSDKEVCGSSTTLPATALVSGSGYWTLRGGSGVISNSTLYNSTVTGLGLTTNTFRWTVIDNGCTAYDEVNVYNNNPDDAVAGSDLEVCTSSGSLSANNPSKGTGYWQVVGISSAVISNSTTNNTTVSNLSSGANTFRWTTVYKNCTLSDDMIIYNNSVSSNAGSNQTVCSTTATLGATSPSVGTGFWTVQVGKNAILGDATKYNTSVSNLDAGATTFTWTVTEGSCSKSSDVTVINSSVQAIATDASVCSSTTTLTATDPTLQDASAKGYWKSVPVGVSFSTPDASTLFNATVLNLSAGGNAFTWKVYNASCADSIDIVISNNEFTANAGSDITKCADETDLNALNLSGSTGYWKLISGSATISNSTLYNSHVTNLQKGDNVFRWTVTKNNCTSFDDVVVTNNLPDQPIAMADFEVCTNSTPISANNPVRGTGYWYVKSGAAVISNSDNNNTTASSLGVGTNILSWKIEYNNCSLEDDLVIRNNTVTTDADKSEIACSSTYNLKTGAPAIGTGVWTLVSGSGIIANSTLYNTTVSSLGAGSNVFQWTLTNGTCTDVQNVTISNNSFVINAGADDSTCVTYYDLDGDNPGTGAGVWTVTKGAGIFNNESVYNTRVTALAQGENKFLWTVTKDGCTASDEVLIKNNTVVADAGTDPVDQCATSNWVNAVPTAGTTGQWTTDVGAGNFINDTSSSTLITNLDPGTNVFRWTVTSPVSGCSAYDQVTVVNNYVTASAGSDDEICTTSYTLNGNQPPSIASGLWTKIGGLATITNNTLYNTTVTGLSSGVNEFKWTVTAGTCSASDNVIITNNEVTADAGPATDQTCSNSYKMTAINPTVGNGEWTVVFGGATIDNSTLYNTNVYNLSVGTNKFRWTVTQGICSAYDEIEITSDSIIVNAGADFATCSVTANLDGSVPLAGSTGTWSVIAGAATISQSTLYNTAVSDLGSGTTVFRWTMTDGVCSNSDDVAVTNNAIAAKPEQSFTQCVDTAVITAYALNTGEIGIWSVVGGGGSFKNASTNITTVTNIPYGLNKYKWTVTNSLTGCSAVSYININNQLMTVDAGLEQTVCSTTATLDGSIPSTGETGVWTQIVPTATIDNSTAYNSTVSNLSSGVNTFTWTLSNGTCSNSDVVSITNNSFTVSLPSTVNVCGTSYQLPATDPLPGTGVWTIISGSGTIQDNTLYNSYINNLPNGTTTLRWTVTKNSCTAYDEISIINDTPDASATATQIVCSANSSISASTPSLGTGRWEVVSSSGIIQSSTSENTMVNGLDPGANYFRWIVTSTSGCEDTAEVKVMNNYFTVDAGKDQNICDYTTTFDATDINPGSGTWTLKSGTADPIADPTKYNGTVTGLGRGQNVFTWTVSYNGCTASDDVNIWNDLPTDPEVNPTYKNQSVCSTTAEIRANSPSIGTGYWSPLGGTATISTPSANNTFANNLAPGMNKFVWTITYKSCSLSDTAFIDNNTVTAYAGPDKTICVDNYTMGASLPSGNGEWSIAFGAGTFANSTSPNTLVTNIGQGINRYVWTISENGCSGSDYVEITNNKPSLPLAGVDEVICVDNYTLGANSPAIGTGVWTREVGSATITEPTDFNSTVTNLSWGINRFRWTITNYDCSLYDEVDITNNSVSPLTEADKIVCSSTATIAATVPVHGTGVWSATGLGTIADPTAATTTVSGLAVGTNKFNWTVTYGSCSAIDGLEVTNNSVTVDAGSYQEICTTSTNLAGNNPVNGTGGSWSIVGISSAVIDNSTQYNTLVSNITLGTSSTFRWTITNGYCSDYDEVTVKNASFNTFAGVDQNSCNDYTYLSGDDPGAGNSGLWTKVGAAGDIVDDTKYNTQVINLLQGPNVYRWTVTKGSCSDADEVTIYNDKPTTAYAGVDQEVCNNSVILSANPPSIGTGKWSQIYGSGTIDKNTDNSTTVSNLAQGLNIFVWKIDYNSCSSTDTVNVYNNYVTAVAGNDIEVCTSSATINADDPSYGTGEWSIINFGTINNPTQNITTATNLNTGVNTFRWTVTEGNCNAYDEISVTNNSITADAGADQNVCSTTGTLQGNTPSATTGYWAVSGSGLATIDNSTAYNSGFSNLAAGTSTTFSWTITKGSCTSSDEVVVTNHTFTINAGDPQSTCSPNANLLAEDASPGTGIWTTVGSGATFVNNTLSNTQVTNLDNGINTLRWTVTRYGCTAFDEVQITNNAPSTANAGADVEVCTSSGSLLAVQPFIGTGYWATISGTGKADKSTSYNTSVSNLSSGANVFRWTVVNANCTSSDDVVVTNNSVTASVQSDKEICSSSTTINADIPALGTGEWQALTSGILDNKTYYSVNVTNIALGDNTFQWTVREGSCSDVATMAVTNNSVTVEAGNNQSTCASTYQLQANNPSPGTGYWTIVGSSAAIIVNSTQYNTNVNALPAGETSIFKWTVTRGICSASDEVSITNNQFTIFAGPTQTLCVDTAVMLAEDAAPGTGQWTLVGGTATIINDTDNNTIVRGLGKGDNILRWTVSRNGCTDTDDVILRNNAPTAAYAGLDQSTCNPTATLQATKPTIGTGNWYNVGGAAIIATPTSYVSSVSGLLSGVNKFRWTVTNEACSSSDTVEIVNKGLVTPYAGQDQELCVDYTTLNVADPSPASGLWSVSEGSATIDNVTATNINVSSLGSGVNKLRWTISQNGCSAYDEVQITVNSPTIANAGNDNTTCASTYNLVANQPDPGKGTGEWSLIDGIGSITQPSDYNTTVTGLGAGANKFRWTITLGTCNTYDEIIITNKSVTAEAGANVDICVDTVQLAATIPSDGTGVWTRFGSGTIENPNLYNTVVKDLASGTNKFRWTVDNGTCSAYDEVTITNNAFVVNAGSDQEVCINNTTLNGSNHPTGSGTWTLGSGTAVITNTTLYNTTVTSLGEGLNSFIWSVTENGCTFSDTVDVTNVLVTANAGVGATVCADSAQLGAIPPSKGAGNWARVLGSGTIDNNTLYNTWVRNLGKGDNTFRWTVTYNSCSAYSDVVVTNDAPSDAVTGTDVTTCSSSAPITAIAPIVGVGKWSLAFGGGTIGDVNNNNTTVSGLNSGINRFIWTVTNNSCTSTDEIIVTNNEVKPEAGANKEVCTSSIKLEGIDVVGGKGEWTSIGNTATIVNSTLYNSDVTNMAVGQNTFKWTVYANGCSGYDEVVITNSSVTANAGTAQDVCYPNVTLAANDPGTTADGTWKVVSGAGVFDNSTLFNTSVTGLNRGVNRFRWTVIGQTSLNCTDSSDVIITNNQVVTDAGVDANTCSTTYQLFAQNPSSGYGTWTVEEGTGVFDNATLYNTNVTGMQQGTNKYKWTVTEPTGCSASDYVIINNISVSANAGFDDVTCETYYRLGANNPGSGTGIWTVSSGSGTFDADTLYNTYVRDIAKGVNTFKWTVTQGQCSAFDEVVITSNAVFVDAGNDENICTDNTTLNGSSPGAGTGAWSIVYGTATFENYSQFNTNITNVGSGLNTYKWTVTEGNCSASDMVDITNNEFIVSAGNDKAICIDTIQLKGTVPTATGAGQWTYVGGNGASIVNSTLYNTVVRSLAEGVNTFKWSVSDKGCTFSDQVIITNNSFSTFAGADQTICSDNTSLVGENPNEGTNTGSGVWTVNTTATINNPTLYNTSVSALTAGVNTFTWTLSRNGCSASDDVAITYNKVIATVGSDATECSSTGNLVANQPQYGTGIWTLRTGSGDIVNPKSSSTIVNNLGPGVNKFRWTVTNQNCTDYADMSISNNSFNTSAGGEQRVCADSTQLAASDPGTGYGVWTVESGYGIFEDKTKTNTKVSGLNKGENIFKWSVTNNGCTAEALVYIYNDLPTAPSVGADQIVCNNQATLVGNNPTVGTGVWTVESGSGTINNNTYYNATVTNLGKGSNKLVWTITNRACSLSDFMIIYNNTVIANAGVDQTLCADQTTMTATDPGTGASGIWIPQSGTGLFDDATDPRTRVYNLGSGKNVFRWTVTEAGSGCTAYADVSITNNIPTTAVVGNDKSVCTSSLAISANAPVIGTGYWSIEGGSGDIAEPTSYNTTVNNLGTGINTLRWTITQGACSSWDEFEIDNNEVYVSAGLDRHVCGQNTALQGNFPSSGTGIWTVESGTGILENPTVNNTNVTNLSTGTNTFKWTVTRGSCSASDLVILTNDAFEANAGIDQSICTDKTTLVANDPPIGQGEWSVSAGAGTIKDPSQFVTEISGLAKGSNTIRWTVTENGCSNYDEVEITNNSVSATVGGDRIICTDNTSLVANDPATQNAAGYWELVGGAGTFTQPSSYLTDVTGLGQGQNTLRWHVYSSLCSDYDDIVIKNNEFSTSAGADMQVCSDTTVLVANDPLDGRGEWSVVAGSGSFDNYTSYTTTVRNLSNGANTFKWTAYIQGCSASAQVVITNNFYQAEAGVNQVLCVDNTVLSAIQPDAGVGVWSIASGSGIIQDPNLSNSQVTNLGPGTNILKWTVTKDGCSSYDLVEITNNKVTYSAGLPQDVCSPSVTLQADQPQNGGVGSWSLVGGSGTFSDKTIPNPLVRGLFTGANTFRWTVTENGCTGSSTVTITNNEFKTDAGPDQIVVVNNATMNAKNGIGQWDILSGQGSFSNPYQFNTDVVNLGIGTNVFRWTVTENGCTASDEVTIIYKAFTANAGEDQVLCTDSTILTASLPEFGEGVWEKVSGSGFIENLTKNDSKITNLGRGDNVFRWSVCKNGFCVSDEVTITNNSFDIDAGENQEACVNYATMNAEDPGVGGNGSWIILRGGGAASGNIPNADINGLQPGENVWQWTVTRNGCVDQDTVVLTYHQPPSAMFTVDNDAACSPLDVNFQNATVGASSYVWTFGDGQFSQLQNPSHTFENLTDKDTTYHIELKAISDFGCVDTARYDVNVYAIPTVSFEVSPFLLNQPSMTTYFILDDISKGYLDYRWNFGDGGSSTLMNPVSHTYTDPGEYTITLEIASAYCNAIDSAHLTIVPAPPEPIDGSTGGKTVEGCQPLTVPFTPETDYADEYIWYFGNGDSAVEATPVYTFEEPGKYFVQLLAKGAGGESITQIDTVIVYPVPDASFTVSPDTVMAGDEYVSFNDSSINASTWEWRPGVGDTVLYERNPIFIYDSAGVYDVTLLVTSNKACEDSLTLRNAVVVEPRGQVDFPSAFTPNPNEMGDGTYIYGDVSRAHLNDVLYPVPQVGIEKFQMQIYNRWGELIFESNDLKIGWNGYYKGQLVPQDVYIVRYKVTYKNGRSEEGAKNVTVVR